MRVELDRKTLVAALKAVAVAVAKRTTKPVLQCVKLEAGDGKLTVTATDTELAARRVLAGVAVTRTGAALVPAADALSILSAAASGSVTLDAEPSGTSLQAGKSRFRLPSWPADEFPDPADGPAGGGLEAAADDLTGAVARVRYAAEPKPEASIRFSLSAVLFDRGPDGLSVVAADGRRIAATPLAPPEGAVPAVRCLIPPAAADALAGLVAGDGEPVAVAFGESEAAFRTGRSELRTRLVAGRYPPWRDHLAAAAKNCTGVAVLPTRDFLARLREAAAVSDEVARRVRFELSPGRLALTVEKSAKGSGEVELELPGFAGPDHAADLDPLYVTQFAAAVSDEPELTFRFEPSGKFPAVLFEAGRVRYMLARMVDV